jgi:hypothetical protein
MANRKSTKGQTRTYKSLHRKLKIEQHLKQVVNSGAPVGQEVPAPSVLHVITRVTLVYIR